VAGPYAQDGFRARFDWGRAGAQAVAPGTTVAAVVDVLSFTTALTVAVDVGIEVLPYPWRDPRAAAFARRHDAVLAVRRDKVTRPGQVSLSPPTIRAAADIDRLVLPSPNGSTIAWHLAGSGAHVLGVSLRNIDVAADWTAQRLRDDPEAAVAVIAAGEQWPDGALRPAVEDLLGEGALLAGLADRGVGPLSPEAGAAAAAWRDAAGRLPELIHDCASARELVADGYPDDVSVAVEVNASRSVPYLSGERFVAVG
jgi:2-phosphosulfolactate phosphatase